MEKKFLLFVAPKTFHSNQVEEHFKDTDGVEFFDIKKIDKIPIFLESKSPGLFIITQENQAAEILRENRRLIRSLPIKIFLVVGKEPAPQIKDQLYKQGITDIIVVKNSIKQLIFKVKFQLDGFSKVQSSNEEEEHVLEVIKAPTEENEIPPILQRVPEEEIQKLNNLAKIENFNNIKDRVNKFQSLQFKNPTIDESNREEIFSFCNESIQKMKAIEKDFESLEIDYQQASKIFPSTIEIINSISQQSQEMGLDEISTIAQLTNILCELCQNISNTVLRDIIVGLLIDMAYLMENQLGHILLEKKINPLNNKTFMSRLLWASDKVDLMGEIKNNPLKDLLNKLQKK